LIQAARVVLVVAVVEEVNTLAAELISAPTIRPVVLVTVLVQTQVAPQTSATRLAVVAVAVAQVRLEAFKMAVTDLLRLFPVRRLHTQVVAAVAVSQAVAERAVLVAAVRVAQPQRVLTVQPI
jgi:hypothetical protein